MVKIATKVYSQEDITLQDGTDVVLKPLVIGKLRRFMKRWDDIAEAGGDEYKSMDIFIDVCGIALEDNYKGKFESLKGSVVDVDEAEAKKKEPNIPVLSNQYREYLEDTLEMDSIYKIIEICGGIKLNDPKLLEQVLAMNEAQEAGTD